MTQIAKKPFSGKVLRLGAMPKPLLEESTQLDDHRVLRLGGFDLLGLGGKKRSLKDDPSDEVSEEDAQAESRAPMKSKAVSEYINTPDVSVQAAETTWSFPRVVEILEYLSPVETIAANLKKAASSSNPGPEFFGLSGPTPYFAQSDEWSCGYRNIQMLLGSLLILQNAEKADDARRLQGAASATTDAAEECAPAAKADGTADGGGVADSTGSCIPVDLKAALVGVLGDFKEPVPSVKAIQALIEWSWANGFDSDGKKFFEPEGLNGTNSWIGATEIWALLSGLGLRTKIVDFEGTQGEPAGSALVKWLRAYFHFDDSGATTSTLEEGGVQGPERSNSSAVDEVPDEGDVAVIRSTAGFGNIGAASGSFEGGAGASGSIFEMPAAGGSGGGGVAAELAQHWASAWRAGKARCIPPVFLQHSPHSRTVVGMVRGPGNGEFLVVLDPARYLTITDLCSATSWKDLVLLPIGSLLQHEQMQAVHVLPGKVLESELTHIHNPDHNTFKR